VAAATIQPGVDRLCRAGSVVELRWVHGGHVSTLADPVSARGALSWMHDRFAGRRVRSGC
jgi:hypothetical protein